MRKITSGEFTRFRTAQTNTFNCKCTLTKITLNNSDYGDAVESVTSTTTNIDCGFYITGGTIQYRNSIIPVEYDAVIRLPLTVTVGINDQITITNLNGLAVNIAYKLKEYPVIGDSVQVFKLVKMSS